MPPSTPRCIMYYLTMNKLFSQCDNDDTSESSGWGLKFQTADF